ncbi:hypothetical protein COB64_00440 [Candidatus Wolfebacteria bacterium]|nr:MAG: hypothetical protein COB64_00440 [Candidatus Wolfebacteria bacterium]
MKRKFITTVLYVCLILLVAVIGFTPFADTYYERTPGFVDTQSSDISINPLVASVHTAAQVKTDTGNLISRVAPGDFLPISVKLINFGSGRRVDVTITYQIFDARNIAVIQETETVAVETTASFVKFIQIPKDFSSGSYVAASSIAHEGQEVPATSSFQFDVEKKFGGIFVSQLIIIGIITLAIGLAFAVVSRLILKKYRSSRFVPHDYSHILKDDRLFYEMISDTIMQMRHRVGDTAIDLASDIDGLTIDDNTGEVLKITKNPAKIIALLVLRYENELGEKVSFDLRKTDEETKARARPIDKNLVVVRKYFSKHDEKE